VTAGSDEELVERLVRYQDAGAFHALYLRHTPALFAMAARLSHERADAEDVVHDTWLRAVAGLSRFRSSARLRTWLTSILINRIRETRRARTFDSLDDIPPMHAPVSLPADVASIDLEQAISRMPAGYRDVLIMHDVEGFTHDEIAGVLGIEPGTSKSQLARGRRWLRVALHELGEGQ
jgi:RNA polymerase sigma-70 factor (ECF subfamily)